jgi:hypothetical protein
VLLPGVDPEEIDNLADTAMRLWRDYLTPESNISCEEPLSADIHRGGITVGRLVGHADVVINDEANGNVIVIDWKTGWGPVEHPWQLKGYSLCLREQCGMPAPGYIIAIEAWLRTATWRVYHLYDADLDKIRDTIAELFFTSRSATPGRHCAYCAARMGRCQEYTEWLNAMALIVMSGRRLGDYSLGELWEPVKLLESMIARYKSVVRERLTNGPLSLGDGREICYKDRDIEKLRPLETIKTLNKHGYGNDDIARCLRIPKAEIQNMIGDYTGKGEKTKKYRALMKELRGAGGTDKITQRRIHTRKVGDE